MARRGVRVLDLRNAKRMRDLVEKGVEHANGQLARFDSDKRADAGETIALLERLAERLLPLAEDVSLLLNRARKGSAAILLEGAQGSLLDVDHGTYPYVTSSNTGAGAVANGAGVAPKQIGYVVGISKAYTTRVGSGPFPTELDDALGERLRQEGGEFGATTGRPRRCGWFDAVVVRKGVRLSGVDAVALTKLDVLTGIDPIRVCTGYRLDGKMTYAVPALPDDFDRCEPVYEDLPGWTESITAARSIDDLPANARAYVRRLEELIGVPVGILSTGPGRDQTTILLDPFG